MNKNAESKKDDLTRDPIYLSDPQIFFTSSEDIQFNLDRIFLSDSNAYEKFIGQGIILNLYCDTLSCEIDSIKIEGNDMFPYYSSNMIHYFKKLSPINCLDTNYRKKFSEYDILIGDWGDGLFFRVDYGYRPNDK